MSKAPQIPVPFRGTDAVYLEGSLSSTDWDMPERQDELVRRLQADGYVVYIRSFLAGQPIMLWLKKREGLTSPEIAGDDLARHIGAMGADYSPLASWTERFVREVVKPTVEEPKLFGFDLKTLVLVGAGLYGAGLLVQVLGLFKKGR